MESGLVVALGALAAVLLVVVGVLLGMVLSGRRSTREQLEASRVELAALQARWEQVESALPATAGLPVVPQAEYLITTAGVSTGSTTRDRSTTEAAPTGAVLSVTLGEPLVKAVALGYGVRRALSAESRNRIAFHMRREVRRARKQRRRAARRAAHEATVRNVGSEAAA